MSCNNTSALVALLTVGSQNEDINKNPQVSLFVYSHLRITHFSQIIVNSNNFDGNNSLSCGEQTLTFGRNGDLLNFPYLRFDLPGIANCVTCKASTFTIPDELALIGNLKRTFASVLKYTRVHDSNVYGYHCVKVVTDSDNTFASTITSSATGDKKELYDKVYAYAGGISTETILNWYFTQTKTDPLQLSACWDTDTRSFKNSNNTAKYYSHNTFSFEVGDKLQLIESCDERIRAHAEARLCEKNALTFAGPECYWAWGVGYALAECVTLCMGNQQIDRSYGQWMNIWEELTDSTSNNTDNSLYAHRQQEYGEHVHPNCLTTFKTSARNRKRLSKRQSTVFVPVTLGWARPVAMSVPLVACTFNTMSVTVRSARLTDLIHNYGPELEERSGISKNWIATNNSMGNTIIDCTISKLILDPTVETVVIDSCGSRINEFGRSKQVQHGYSIQTKETNVLGNPVRHEDAQIRLVANYVFLQQGERQKFAEGSHEQIIVQTQRQREFIRSCSQTIDTCSFNHPTFGLFAALTANPRTVGVNREPLDGNGIANSVNLLQQPGITHFNVLLNNSPTLPSIYDCELARFDDLNAYNTLFRGTASAATNGAVSVLFCTDAMRAMIQPCGTVNLSKVDNLCFSLRISPGLFGKGLKRERDHPARELLKLESNPDNIIAKSVLAEAELEVSIFATSYNIIRYKSGMGSCKWAL